jgi:hypothetical protein
VLKQGEESPKDSRKTFDGKPLRQSWNLPFLSGTVGMPSDSLYCLFEAQISVAVTGIDHSVWTAYGFIDTYFRSKESVDGYNQLKESMGWRDPFGASQIAANTSCWTPREYFFRVFEIRINEVRREWQVILDKVEGDFNQYVYDVDFMSNMLRTVLQDVHQRW